MNGCKYVVGPLEAQYQKYRHDKLFGKIDESIINKRQEDDMKEEEFKKQVKSIIYTSIDYMFNHLSKETYIKCIKDVLEKMEEQ